MAQLHEVLAVDRDLEKEARKIMEETEHVFSKQRNLFVGVHKTLKMFDNARENEEAAAEQHQELATTVPEKLEYLSQSLIKHIDAVAQKEKTNQIAKADIIIGNGKPLLSKMPATLLLTLETKLSQWRGVFAAIPTLPAGINWKTDADQGRYVYKMTKEKVTNRTEKIRLHKEISPATKEHKAQIDQWTEDRPVGTYHEINWCGMITSAQKSQLLTKIDGLIKAVKQARSRANQEEVLKENIGKKLWDFVVSEVV
jgi:hypothetical protein